MQFSYKATQGYDIKYKNSKQNGNVDCLSRLPIPFVSTAKYDAVDM